MLFSLLCDLMFCVCDFGARAMLLFVIVVSHFVGLLLLLICFTFCSFLCLGVVRWCLRVALVLVV